MTGAEDYLKEIIRLQLKKPRSWNWELSTSKSSPHIALPIIQLYDTKGQLLVETEDNGSIHRQSWHSSQHQETPRSSRKPTYLQRCKSDNLENAMARYRSSVKKTSQPKLETEAKEIRNLSRHIQRCRSDTVAIPSLQPKSKNRSTDSIKSYNSRRKDQSVDKIKDKNATDINEAIFGANRTREKFGQRIKKLENDKRENKTAAGIYHLQKSKSDVLDIKVKSDSQYSLQPLQGYHRRSGSDELFQKTRQKYNIKESLRRAENDGYKNFIYNYEDPVRNRREKSLDNLQETKNKDEKKKRFAGCLATAETVSCNKATNIEINSVTKPKRYRLRPSRAGVLLISDESFSSSHRRRCHGDFGDCREDSNDIIIEADKMSSLEDLPIFREKQRSFRCKPQRSRSEKDNVNVNSTLNDINGTSSRNGHFRQSSDPAGVKTAKFPPNRYRRPRHTNDVCNSVERTESTRNSFSTKGGSQDENCLFYSKSDVFPFRKLIDKNPDYVRRPAKDFSLDLDDNTNYTVQEPVTTPGSESGKNVCDSVSISEQIGRKKRTKLRERISNGSSSVEDGTEADGPFSKSRHGKDGTDS